MAAKNVMGVQLLVLKCCRQLIESCVFNSFFPKKISITLPNKLHVSHWLELGVKDVNLIIPSY